MTYNKKRISSLSSQGDRSARYSRRDSERHMQSGYPANLSNNQPNKKLDNLQIELGYLRQVAANTLERVLVVSSQLNTVTDILELHGGSRAPAEEFA